MGYRNQFPNRFSWLWITVILTEILSKLLTFALCCYYFKLAFVGTKESILGISIWFPRILMFLYYFKMFSVIEIVTLKFLDILVCCYREELFSHTAMLGIPIGLSITMTTTFMTGFEDNKKYKKYVGFSVTFMFSIALLASIMKTVVIKVRFKKDINKEDEFSDNCFLLLFSLLTFEAIQQLVTFKFDTVSGFVIFHIREMAGWKWIAFASYGVIMYIFDENFYIAVHCCSGTL